MKRFTNDYPEAGLHIVRWPLNKEAPFDFEFDGVNVIDKGDHDLESLYGFIEGLDPEVIVCSGWFDKEYISIVRKFHGSVTTVLSFDNYWEGTLKQRIGRFVLPVTITRHFDFCWVPGEVQVDYALKIGFKKEQIYTGFYATDLTRFNEVYTQNREEKRKDYPKSFIYVGRYLELKGVVDLWTAFSEFSKSHPEWELHCVGAGELFDSKMEHPKIIHHGFIQPHELPDLVKKSGVFIMPSHYDHWGMAVQEFAAAGLPLVCSDKVGANCAFLKEGENGYTFEAKNVASLQEKLNLIASHSSEKLIEFGDKSNELSSKITSETWSFTLKEIVNESRKNNGTN